VQLEVGASRLVWHFWAILLDFGQFLATFWQHDMPAKRKKPLRNEWPKVHKVSIRDQVRFKVDGRPQKERLFFRDKNDALVQADVWALERQNQGIEALDFPTALRVEAIDAAGLLKPFGKSLLGAAHFYVAHLQLEQRRKSSLSVAHCIAQWLTIKRTEAQRQYNCSANY